MHPQHSLSEIIQFPRQRRYAVSDTVRRPLYCLLIVLLCYCFTSATPLLACRAAQVLDPPLVTEEIRYHTPEAGEVFLVWGIDGWTVVPDEMRPAGTVVKNKVMHTPMVRQGDTFVVHVQVPAGATIDYGFLITRKRNGAAIEAVWEGDQDYRVIAAQDGVVEVQATITLAHARILMSSLELGLRLLIETCALCGIGTVLIRITRGYDRRTILLSLFGIVLLGLLLRLYVAWKWNSCCANSPERLIGDEPGYDNLARGILSGSGFNWPGRVPLYPLWLAGVYLVTKGAYAAVPYVQSLLGVAVVPLTYALGSRVFDHTVGLLAAFLAAINYVLVQQSLHLLSEILYTPVLLLVAISLWDALHKPTILRFCWAGLWAGISNLVRPTLLLFPLAIIVLLILVLDKWRAVRCWLIYMLAATLVITPWMVRNYVRYQAVFPLQTSNAILWQASPEYYHLVRDQGYTYRRVWSEILYGPGWEALDPTSVEGDHWWTKRALQSIVSEPLVYLGYATEKLITYWIGDPNADWGDTQVFNYQALRRVGFSQWDAVLVMIARVLPILALLASLVVRRKWRTLLPIYALLIYATLLHAATHAEARLSEPLQPYLLAIIAGAVVTTATAPSRMPKPPRPPVQSGDLPMENLGAVLPKRQLTYLRDLLRELVARDMKLRYKRSILGVAWSLLNPLFQMLVFIFLSRRVLSLDIPNYPSFVFTGLLAWNWFQSTLLLATAAITGNRELIRRPGFPVAILPVVTVTTNLIHFLLALPVPLLFLVLSGGRLTIAILILPFVIVLQFLLILGLSYLAATFQVTFRDTQHILAVAFMLLFYLTPVFYDASSVPARYQALYRLNPMFHLITAYRTILIQGALPDLGALLVVGVLGGVLLWIGHTVFTRASYRFVEEL